MANKLDKPTISNRLLTNQSGIKGDKISPLNPKMPKAMKMRKKNKKHKQMASGDTLNAEPGTIAYKRGKKKKSKSKMSKPGDMYNKYKAKMGKK